MSRYSKSDYPVGARWEYRKNTQIFYIELFSRGKMEVWHYGKIFNDGSGSVMDWTTSYSSAKKNHYTSGRFKRVN